MFQHAKRQITPVLAGVLTKTTSCPIVALLANGQDDRSHRKIGCRHCQQDEVGLKKSIHTNLIVVHPADLVIKKADGPVGFLRNGSSVQSNIVSSIQVEMQVSLNERSCGLRYIPVILEVYPDL